MILRSVMKHVRDQNWFAVFLDFLIVVVGVFIGIQVANWNEARLEERQETPLIQRLLVDFDRIAADARRMYATGRNARCSTRSSMRVRKSRLQARRRLTRKNDPAMRPRW